MGNKINYIEDAENDLDEIYDYILKHFYSEEIAFSTVQKIVKGIKNNLEVFSELGVSLDEKIGRKLNPHVEIRMLILDKYLVFYFVIQQTEIYIMRILNSKQDYMKFLNKFSAIATNEIRKNRI